MPTQQYEVLSPLEHDGVRYEPGAHCPLDQGPAQELLKCRVVRPLPEEPGPEKAAKEKP